MHLFQQYRNRITLSEKGLNGCISELEVHPNFSFGINIRNSAMLFLTNLIAVISSLNKIKIILYIFTYFFIF